MPRVRTAKSLANRIDLQYFTKLHPFRGWKLLLSVTVPLIALGWIVAETAFHNERVYTSGPLSPAHAVFANQCALCHVRTANYKAGVEDRTCLSCHDAPVHTQFQTFTPACSSCHVEHRGKPQLTKTSDVACTQCHRDLKAKRSPGIDHHVSGFDHAHPEFAVLRRQSGDPGTIRLNHYKHLQPTLRGPAGQVQMQCYDCHRPNNVNETWPFSVAVVQPASQQPVIVDLTDAQQRKRRIIEAGPGAYMTPIKYVNQCAACHVLQFDPLIATPAPHSTPETVRAFILQKLTEYIHGNPHAINISPADFPSAGLTPEYNPSVPVPEAEPRRKLPGAFEQNDVSQQKNIVRPTGQSVARPKNPQEWVQERAAAAERLLWEKNCKVCHMVTQGSGTGLPTSVKAIIPVRWFPLAEFDHQAHRMLKCTSCHLNIPQSGSTSDVNIPGIKLCRDCHKQGGARVQAAEGRCFECHSYHDWRNERRIPGGVDIREVRGFGPSATPLQQQHAGSMPPAR